MYRSGAMDDGGGAPGTTPGAVDGSANRAYGEGLLEGIELACTRGYRPIFEGRNLRVASGESLQALGANGSGKTSLLRQLAGLSVPTAGQVRWNSREIARCRETYGSALAYVGHAPGVKDELSAIENLCVASALEGVALSEQGACAALDRLGLRGREDQLLGEMSQGQRRRVALTRLVWRRAQIWILDEPLTALDPPAVSAVVELLRQHLEMGGIAVMTSHQSMPLKPSHVLEL